MEVFLLGFLLVRLLHVLEAISLRVKSQLTLDPLSFPASVTPPVTTLPKFQILLPWTCPFRHLPTCPRLNWLNLSPPFPNSPSLQSWLLAHIKQKSRRPLSCPEYKPYIQLFCHFSGWLLPWLWLRPLPVWTVVVSFQPLSPWGSLTSLTPPTLHSWKNPKRTSESFCLFGLCSLEQRSYHALARCLNCWTPRAT